MLNKEHFILPNWPAPPNVSALQTTRNGGISNIPFDTFNLASHVQDDDMHVSQNRQLLNQHLPNEPVWLKQMHGTHVVDAAEASSEPAADASFSKKKYAVCVVMTADCLPILLCNESGTIVAAIHAGWRGLCDGVIEAAVKTLQVETDGLMAWLGPAIGPQAFEVGAEVRAQFVAKDTEAALAFAQNDKKYLANLYQLAKQQLHSLGVKKIYGGDFCTYTNKSHFFSYRRDGETGRMATLIWLT